METTTLAREINALPPEAKRQVADFLAFLKTRYPPAARGRKARRTPLAREPFVGMWQKRKDMADGAAWVRALRRREWGRPS